MGNLSLLRLIYYKRSLGKFYNLDKEDDINGKK